MNWFFAFSYAHFYLIFDCDQKKVVESNRFPRSFLADAIFLVCFWSVSSSYVRMPR